MDYLEIIERRKANMKKSYALALEFAAVNNKLEDLKRARRELQRERQELDTLLFGQMREEIGVPIQEPRIEAEVSDERGRVKS
jgi:hypothetical protein